MVIPFIHTYYNLFKEEKEPILLSFIYCLSNNKLKKENYKILLNEIKNIDYFVVYGKQEFNELKKYILLFNKLVYLKKILYIGNYNEFYFNILLKYKNSLNSALLIDFSRTFDLKYFFNLSNKLKCFQIDECHINNHHNDNKLKIINYIPSSCKIFGLTNIANYNSQNLPNKLSIITSKTLLFNKKSHLPKNAILICYTHLFSDDSFYKRLFKKNSNKIIIDFHQDINHDCNKKTFNKYIIIKNKNNVSINKILGKTIIVETDYKVINKQDDLINDSYMCKDIEDFFSVKDNAKYYWSLLVNTLIDIISINYFILYDEEKLVLKIIDYTQKKYKNGESNLLTDLIGKNKHIF